MKRIALALLVLTGCVRDVDIHEPAPGSMFLAGDPIPLVVETDAGSLDVDLSAARFADAYDVEDRLERTLPPADGLGVVVVAPDGNEEQAATRAFLQGRFRDPAETQPGVVTAWLTPELLDGGRASVAGLLTDMLMEVGLARYVESPVVMPIPVGNLTMDIANVEHGPMTLSLFVDEARRLRLRADISTVVMTYTATHDTMPWAVDYGDPEAPEYGVGTLEWVTVVGTVNLDYLGCRRGASCNDDEVLHDVEVRHSGLSVEDANCIVLGVIDVCSTVEDWMEGGIKVPLAAAAAAATGHTLTHLVSSLEPELGLAFPKPIRKEMELGRAVTRGDSVVLEYDGLIGAVEPVVATEGQGVLRRDDEVEDGHGICLGEGVVNAVSFAAWDAGNLTDLRYTPEQLLEWGLPNEFPWTSIEGARVSAMLPPVLEVRGAQVWVDVGGIVGVVDAGDFGEAIVRGSATVPVEIVRTAAGVRLTVRGSNHELRILGLGFDEAHDLLNREEAARIVEVIVPAMLEGLFEELSNLQLPELGVPPLLPEEGSTARGDVALDLAGIEVVANGWCVPSSIVR